MSERDSQVLGGPCAALCLQTDRDGDSWTRGRQASPRDPAPGRMRRPHTAGSWRTSPTPTGEEGVVTLARATWAADRGTGRKDGSASPTPPRPQRSAAVAQRHR